MGANICNKIFKQFPPQCIQTSHFWPRQIYLMSSPGRDAWVFIAGMAQHVNFFKCYAYHIIWRSTYKREVWLNYSPISGGYLAGVPSGSTLFFPASDQEHKCLWELARNPVRSQATSALWISKKLTFPGDCDSLPLGESLNFLPLGKKIHGPLASIFCIKKTKELLIPWVKKLYINQSFFQTT